MLRCLVRVAVFTAVAGAPACMPPRGTGSSGTPADLEALEPGAGAPAADEAPEPAVAEAYRHRILFSAAPLAADASDADQAFTTWTLGQPLFIHAYGPAPKQVALFAEVNGEKAVAGGAQLVQGSDAALSSIVLDGGGPYPVQGPLAPGDISASPPYGVWRDFGTDYDHQPDRVWSEFHRRVIPMLQVGDNTLTLIAGSSSGAEEYARGTLTIVVPDAAALAAALAASQEELVSGDAKLLKALRKQVEDQLMPKRGAGGEAGELVALGYHAPEWTTAVDDAGALMQQAQLTVIFRLPSDTHRARCRAIALFGRRDASSKSGVVWDPPTLGGVGLETRWTPCPLKK